ncbi:MAG: tRNA (adenosine(37)-N6)-dimethylallyltransferase MiaA [Candidatus Paceibacterota bacterium]|jgi:tRNA dimethylallyltransferase
MKTKLIVVLGQTATGKSALAVELAKKFNGEVVSADSRQVYKRLNLGTGKVTKKEMKGVPHYLLDVASPKSMFTVTRFKKLADKAIKDIARCSKTPILCGGTGFYIEAVVKNIVLPEVKPDVELRKKLDEKSTEQLFTILKKLDPERAKNIDAKNPRRLIRAIEIASSLGNVPHLEAQPPSEYEILEIGTTLPDEILKSKIKKRLLERIKRGMIKEAERLHGEGLSWKRMRGLGLEYRFLADHCENKITKEEMVELLNIAIWQYAKRQKTWFKRDPQIIWINPTKKSEVKIIEKRVKEFLKK